jgi:hypothetical protein
MVRRVALRTCGADDRARRGLDASVDPCARCPVAPAHFRDAVRPAGRPGAGAGAG